MRINGHYFCARFRRLNAYLNMIMLMLYVVLMCGFNPVQFIELNRELGLDRILKESVKPH